MTTMTPQLPFGLITPRQLAEEVGMHRSTIYRYVKSGWITPITVRATGRIGLHPSVVDQVRRPAYVAA